MLCAVKLPFEIIDPQSNCIFADIVFLIFQDYFFYNLYAIYYVLPY